MPISNGCDVESAMMRFDEAVINFTHSLRPYYYALGITDTVIDTAVGMINARMSGHGFTFVLDMSDVTNRYTIFISVKDIESILSNDSKSIHKLYLRIEDRLKDSYDTIGALLN